MKRLTLAAAGMVLSLALAGEAAAQDVIPPMSQDTSKAEKVRVDTMRDTTLGYRPMQGQNPCVVPVEVARAQDAARQEPGRDMARVDTMGPAEIRRDSIPGEPAPRADTLAKAPGAIQEQQADGRQASDSAKVSDSAYAGAVNCDTMGKLTPDAPVDTAQARQLPGLMGPPAQSDTGSAAQADSVKAADKPKDE